MKISYVVLVLLSLALANYPLCTLEQKNTSLNIFDISKNMPSSIEEQSLDSTHREKSIAPQAELSPSRCSQIGEAGTITIYNNDQFAQEAEKNGWPGDGTEDNPYLIRRLSIGITYPYIEIRYTTVYFTFQDCTFCSLKHIIALNYVQNGLFLDCIFQCGSYGIKMNRCANCTIIASTFRDFQSAGLRILDSEQITIQGSRFEMNEKALLLSNSTQILVAGNSFLHNTIGIQISRGTGNNVTKNSLFNNARGGIVLQDCEMNVFAHNTLSHGGLAFSLDKLECFAQIWINNTHDDRPIVLLRDTRNFTLSAAGQIVIVNCSDGLVESSQFINAPAFIAESQRVRLVNNSWKGGPFSTKIIRSQNISLFSSNFSSASDNGIEVQDSINILLSECEVTANGDLAYRYGIRRFAVGDGIRVNHSANITISSCKVVGNGKTGILLTNSSNALLEDLEVSKNKFSGLELNQSSNTAIRTCSISHSIVGEGILICNQSNTNTIFDTSFISNRRGIQIDASSFDNEICWNKFAGEWREYLCGSWHRVHQAMDDGTNNLFDSNFWWDWLTPDENIDGIVDTPYLIAGEAKNNDRQPRTQPHGHLVPLLFARPADFFYQLNTTGHSLEWIVVGSCPKMFTICRNGTDLTTGMWESGKTIAIRIDGLPAGTYNYTIIVDDEMNRRLLDAVWVKVINYIWGVSVGEELIWTYTKYRGPGGPSAGKEELIVPVGNQTKKVTVSFGEGDPLRYVITSFYIINWSGIPKPRVIGNLTIKGVTGINHILYLGTFNVVVPVNINWTEFARREYSPGWEKLVILKDTEDLFEYKIVDIQDPQQKEEYGYLHRYDKHRGILLHRENLDRQRSLGIIREIDFVGPPYPAKDSSNSGICSFFALIVLTIIYRRFKGITFSKSRKITSSPSVSFRSYFLNSKAMNQV